MNSHQTARNLPVLCAVIILFVATGAEFSHLNAFGVSAVHISYSPPIRWAAAILFVWLIYRHAMVAPIRFWFNTLRDWGTYVPVHVADQLGLFTSVGASFIFIRSIELEAEGWEVKYEFQLGKDELHNDTRLVTGAQASALKFYLTKLGFFFRSEFTADYVVPWMMVAAAVGMIVLDCYHPVDQILLFRFGL